MENHLGHDIKKLGFGFMRLPVNGDEIDIEQTKRMVDTFMKKGFTYFDSAYVYSNGKSEEAMKAAIVERYPRDSFTLASKLPLWECKTPEDMEKCFEVSCERAGVSFFDFYLLHAMDKSREEMAHNLGAWEYMKKLKEQGKITHLGFSFHDSAEVLDDILTKHPEAEFVQLQINYADWENKNVQSRKCYETARKHGNPVVIMEPVKGGALAGMVPEIRELFEHTDPDASVASWAIRYAASLDGIITVLSGMSSEAQLNDNCSFMEDFKPLTDSERVTIARAVEILDSIPTIPCTGCKYCVDGCPQKIKIPDIFSTMNRATMFGDSQSAKNQYKNITKESGKASDCIKCRSCENHCPQHIEITKELERAALALE